MGERKNSIDNVIYINRNTLSFQELIGEGYYGKVYKGYLQHKAFNYLVAIKICQEHFDQEIQQKLLEEAKIQRSFSHPHIIRLIGVNNDDTPWLVMEYAKFGPLTPYLKANKSVIQLDNLLMYIHQLAKAMSYLEDQKFIHRDIATRNVLVTSHDCVKLADFGLSRYLGNEDMYMLHTVRKLPVKWMSPESLHLMSFSSKSDVWMFGVCMWEILTIGEKPFKDLPNDEVIARIEKGIRLKPPELSPKSINNLMSKCWRYNPNDRPNFHEIEKTIGEVIEARKTGFQEILGDIVDSTFAPPKPERASIAESINLMTIEPAKFQAPSTKLYSCDIPTDPNQLLKNLLENQQRESEEDALWLKETETNFKENFNKV